MNKRIEELAKQAGFYADKYVQCKSQFGNVLVDGGDFIDLEKFAELIVKECCSIVLKYPGIVIEDVDDDPLSYASMMNKGLKLVNYTTCHDISVRLMNEFGDEE